MKLLKKLFAIFAFALLFSGCKGSNFNKLSGAEIAFKDVISSKYVNLGDSNGYAITVHSNMVTFQFADHVETSKKAEWTVSRDVEGNDLIPSKTIELAYGNPSQNFAYVHVSNKNENKTYPVLIHRNFEYVVTFYNQYSGTTIKRVKVEEGNRIEQEDFPPLPSNPPKGYSFIGWSRGPHLVTSNTQITLAVRAHNSNVVLKPRGGMIDGSTSDVKLTITYDATYTLKVPTKTGYKFDGWYTSITGGTKVDNSGTWKIDQENVNLYAQWTVNQYTVTWKNGGTTIYTEQCEYNEIPFYKGSTPTKAPDAQYTYTFSGWYPELAPIRSNTVFEAQFQTSTNTYTITWKDENGSVLETDENVPYGTTPSYDGATPTKDGDAQYSFIFTGWSPAVTQVTGNTTYIAQYTQSINNYTIRFLNYDDSVLYSTTVEYGSSVSYSGPTPIKPDGEHEVYTFSGWDTTVLFVTTNLDIRAQYSKKYKYNFTFNDGAIEEVLVPENDDVTKYYPTNTSTSIMGDEERSYHWIANGDYAFIEEETVINVYYITYVLDGGTNSELNPQLIHENEIVNLSDPIKTGYIFNGWFLDDSEVETLSNVSSDLTLVARWSIEEYQINYHLDGGTNHIKNPSSYTCEDTISLRDASKTGYTFCGWYLDELYENEIEIIEHKNSDIDLYAKFEPNQYVVSFDSNGGNYSQPLTITLNCPHYSQQMFELNDGKTANPYVLWNMNKFRNYQYQGYYFEGWYLDSNYANPFDSDISITENIELYGKWSERTYSPKYELKDNNTVTVSTAYQNPEQWTYAYCNDYAFYVAPNIKTITLSASLEGNSGAYFLSYQRNQIIGSLINTYGSVRTMSKTIEVEPGEIIVPIKQSKGGLWTVTASELRTNTISTSNIRTENILYDSSINPPSLERNGYEFIGWEDRNHNVIQENYSYETNMEFSAKWQPIDYSIDYELFGGVNNQDNPLTYTIEDTIILLNPEKTGYTFLGWYRDPNFSESITTINNMTGALHLYAKFVPNTYSLTIQTNGGSYAPKITFIDGDTILRSKYLFAGEMIERYVPSPKEGYLFAGWYKDSEFTDLFVFNQTITEDTTLYAKWIECNNETTTIETSPSIQISVDGTNENFVSFVPIADCTITITSQSVDIDLFGKLYDSNGNVLVSSDDISDEDLDFSLTYNLVAGETYHIAVKGNTISTSGAATLVFDYDGECIVYGTTLSDSVVYYQYGSNYYLPENAILDGYTFVGWFDDANNQYTSGVWNYTENITVNAVWEQII